MPEKEAKTGNQPSEEPKEKKGPDEEAEKAQAEADEVRRAGALISPEGVMMLTIAVIIDIIDFFIASILVLDIVAILTIGFWMFFRSNQLTVTKGAATRLTRLARSARWLKPLLIILEWIPVVGMLPLWVLVVYLELKQ